jgi:preprotein translocase subunit SecD
MEVAQTSWIDWFISLFGAILSFVSINLGGATAVSLAPAGPTYDIVLKTDAHQALQVSDILIDRLASRGIIVIANQPKPDGMIQMRIQTALAGDTVLQVLTAPGKVEIAEALTPEEFKAFSLTVRTVRSLTGEEFGIRKTVMQGQIFASAEAAFDPNTAEPTVTFRMTPEGAADFAKLTTDNIGKIFAIIIDDVVISAPRIQTPITGGSGMINGSMTIEQARDIATVMSAKPLPAKVTLERIDRVTQ